MKLKVILTVFIALSFNFAAKAENERFGNVKDVQWQLVGIDGKDLQVVENIPYVYLSSINSRITGFAGCNRIVGSYKFGKLNQIKFVNSFTTMKACETDMDLESEFLIRLEKTTMFRREKQYLYLLNEESQEILRFKNE